MRKSEGLDAEERARRSDMSCCGIDAWKMDEIPFGVRAIQRGVEVDGIWISHSDSEDLSQVVSSATLIGDQGEKSRCKGKTPERILEKRLQERSTSESTRSRTDESAPPAHQAWSQVPATRLRCLTQAHCEVCELQEAFDTPIAAHFDAYIPSGTAAQLRPEPRHLAEATTNKTVPTPDYAPHTVHTRELGDPVVYGAARIHANRDFRRPNKGFEILPAGALGPRHEFQDSSDGSKSAGNAKTHVEQVELRRGRLRKKPPTSQLRPRRDVST